MRRRRVSRRIRPGDDGKDEEEEAKEEDGKEVLQVKDEPTDEEEAKSDNLLEVTRKLKRKAGRMIEELRSLRRTSLVQSCGLFLICLLLNVF